MLENFDAINQGRKYRILSSSLPLQKHNVQKFKGRHLEALTRSFLTVFKELSRLVTRIAAGFCTPHIEKLWLGTFD